jgi:hypothetical protein
MTVVHNPNLNVTLFVPRARRRIRTGVPSRDRYRSPRYRRVWRPRLINEHESSFGAGWDLEGLQRLHTQPDKTVFLTDGDGTAQLYRTGTGLRFDGEDNFISVPNDPAIHPTTAMTVELWLKADRWEGAPFTNRAVRALGSRP